jgi:TfoX/Sxy family transcriptional regulator of competence genes
VISFGACSTNPEPTHAGTRVGASRPRRSTIIWFMAYDEELADRVRELIGSRMDVTEKQMFGGLAFLIGGNMSVSVSGKGGLMLRCDPEETEALLRKPHAGPFEMRGRVMDGWLRVETDGLRTRTQLERWVVRGVEYAGSLPPKKSSRK